MEQPDGPVGDASRPWLGFRPSPSEEEEGSGQRSKATPTDPEPTCTQTPGQIQKIDPLEGFL